MFFVRKVNQTKVHGPVPIEKLTYGLSVGKLSPNDYHSKNRNGPWKPLSQLINTEEADEDDDFLREIKIGAEVKKIQKKKKPLTSGNSVPKFARTLPSFSLPKLPDLQITGVSFDLIVIFCISVLPWVPLIAIFPEIWPLFVVLFTLLILSWLQFFLMSATQDDGALYGAFTWLMTIGNGVMLWLCLLQYYLQTNAVYGVEQIPNYAFYLTFIWQVFFGGIVVSKLTHDFLPIMWAAFYYWVTQILLVLILVTCCIPKESSYLMYALSGKPIYLFGNYVFPKDIAEQAAEALAQAAEEKRVLSLAQKLADDLTEMMTGKYLDVTIGKSAAKIYENKYSVQDAKSRWSTLSTTNLVSGFNGTKSRAEQLADELTFCIESSYVSLGCTCRSVDWRIVYRDNNYWMEGNPTISIDKTRTCVPGDSELMTETMRQLLENPPITITVSQKLAVTYPEFYEPKSEQHPLFFYESTEGQEFNPRRTNDNTMIHKIRLQLSVQITALYNSILGEIALQKAL